MRYTECLDKAGHEWLRIVHRNMVFYMEYDISDIEEAEEEENDILFYVEDNGCGICEEDLKEVLNKERKSIGVRNTNKRIRMIYGEKYGVTISSQLEEGTVVTIRLPLKVNSKKQS